MIYIAACLLSMTVGDVHHTVLLNMLQQLHSFDC